MNALARMTYLDLCSARECNVCLNLQMATKPSNILIIADQKLSKCSDCKLVVYCGKEHQKIDWPRHRELCRAVKHIMWMYGVPNLFCIVRNPQNAEELRRSTLQAKLVLRTVLQRPLKFYEHELVSYPACCNVCATFGVLQPCKECFGVSYCSEEHRLLDHEHHKIDCGMLSLYYCPYKVQAPNDEWIKQLKHRVDKMASNDLVSAFQQATDQTLPLNPMASRSAYEFFASASDFTGITTICYVLSCWNSRKIKDEELCIICIVGATNERLLWFRRVQTQFFFLQYPQYKQLQLFFIGPEAVKQETTLISDKYVFLNKARFVAYITIRSVFEDLAKTSIIRPSIIMAYNCGFGELDGPPPTQNPWTRGIRQMLHFHNVPIAFTSCTLEEALSDFDAVKRIIDENDSIPYFKRLIGIKVNQYRDLRPIRIWRKYGEAMHCWLNGYVQAIETFAKA